MRIQRFDLRIWLLSFVILLFGFDTYAFERILQRFGISLDIVHKFAIFAQNDSFGQQEILGRNMHTKLRIPQLILLIVVLLFCLLLIHQSDVAHRSISHCLVILGRLLFHLSIGCKLIAHLHHNKFVFVLDHDARWLVWLQQFCLHNIVRFNRLMIYQTFKVAHDFPAQNFVSFLLKWVIVEANQAYETLGGIY